MHGRFRIIREITQCSSAEIYLVLGYDRPWHILKIPGDFTCRSGVEVSPCAQHNVTHTETQREIQPGIFALFRVYASRFWRNDRSTRTFSGSEGRGLVEGSRPPLLFFCCLSNLTANNKAACDYDGGDCCHCDCDEDAVFDCGTSGYDCIDPNSECYGGKRTPYSFRHMGKRLPLK